jgi:hypothetical protein
MSAPAHRHDVALALLFAGLPWRHAEVCPLLHQLAPLMEHIAAPVASLDIAPGGVGQGSFDRVAGMCRALVRPIGKRASESVRCLVAADAVERRYEIGYAERRARLWADEKVRIAGLADGVEREFCATPSPHGG